MYHIMILVIPTRHFRFGSPPSLADLTSVATASAVISNCSDSGKPSEQFVLLEDQEDVSEMEKRTEKSDIAPINKEWQALRLQELIVFLKTQKGSQWKKAEQEGKLSEFIRQYLWLWGIHVAYWEQYQFSPWEFQFECTYERSVHTVSTALNGLYQDRYRQELIPGQKDYGVVATMLSLRSPLRVTRPLKELQLQCLGGAALCMGLSAASLVRGRIGSASLLAASAIDLQTISYNCYEKRYGDLYLQQLSGDVNALCDTAYALAKSLLGITPLTTNPLLRLSGKINWDILLTDTIAQYACKQVKQGLDQYVPPRRISGER